MSVYCLYIYELFVVLSFQIDRWGFILDSMDMNCVAASYEMGIFGMNCSLCIFFTFCIVLTSV